MKIFSRWAHRAARRNERGATFIITAFAMVILMGAGAMGVDLGIVVDGNRETQAMADTAALDMARYINLADGYSSLALSNQYMAARLAYVKTDNNLSSVTLTAQGEYYCTAAAVTSYGCTLGTWNAPPANGGCYRQVPPRNPPCTGVLVTATETVPSVFGTGPKTVSRSALASVAPADGFSIGTFLASINTTLQLPVQNAILSKLGTNMSITAVGYQGLVNSYVTVNQLIAASSGVLTTSNVMTASLTAQQWFTIWKQALLNQGGNCTNNPSPCNAYTAISVMSPSGSASTTVQLCQLVSINGSNCTSNSTLSLNGLSASINVLQTLTTEAELANGTSAIDLGSSLDINNVSDAQLFLTVIQPAQANYGPVGTTATTAQVQATMQLTLVGGYVMNIPLSVASGTATLSSLTCTNTNNTFAQAVINGSTNALSANMTLAQTSTSVPIALATATVSGASGTATFTNVDTPPAATLPYTGTNPNPYQIGWTAPTFSIPLNPDLPGWVTALEPVLLTTLITTLDSSLGMILQGASVTVAGADIANLKVDCGAVSLVK